MISAAATHDYFDLLQLPPTFQVDMDRLDRHYRELQGRVHPDRAAHLSDLEKRTFLQYATAANEAYHTLKRPLERARYMLRRDGLDTGEERNNAMSAEFLLEQIEWREELHEARSLKNVAALDRLAARLRNETERLITQLAQLLDVDRQPPAAVDVVRQLAFFERLARDLDEALVELED